jgi:hypothetical protein
VLATAAQFKNKYVMNWISAFDQDHKCSCQWNFLATCHGRGIWDAEGGRIKAKLVEVNKRATEPGDVPLKEAKDLVDWANKTEEGRRWCGSGDELATHVIVRRQVHHLSRISRPARKEVEPLTGIRSLYCVSSCGTVGRVDYCKMSCYCPPCLRGDYDDCMSSDALGVWKTHVF